MFEYFRRVCRYIPFGWKLYYFVVMLVPLPNGFVHEKLKGKVFFITSTGRTGTTLFARIIDSSDGFFARHEPVLNEQFFHRKAIESPSFSDKYIFGFRMKEIFLTAPGYPYCEVNSAIRRFAASIKKYDEGIPIIHVVRNGKDVVSSVLNRDSLTDRDPVYYGMVPHASFIENGRWERMSRFEKICYMWSEENKWLSENSDITVRFEDIIKDYGCFKSLICDRIGVSVEEKDWEKICGELVNQNRHYDESNKPENWSLEDKNKFSKLCSDQMHFYGYHVD